VQFELNKVYRQYCQFVSLADFMVIIGEAIMGRTANDYIENDKFNAETHLGVSLRAFQYGRTTALTCDWNVGRMPNPINGCAGLKDVFVDHIYFDHPNPWGLIAAITGAHTLGSAR
jgi:hypothetical protein